jgi:outer membrane lipoprotein-sorting protein
MSLRRCFFCLLAVLLLPPFVTAQSADLLTRIWDGVQQAQGKFTTGCGTVVETRTSKLMLKPMVLRGKFCAEGMTRFTLEYAAPNALRIRFNTDYLNVTGGDGNTQVLEIGSGVRRAQSAFSREGSLAGLKKNFTITVQENAHQYEMHFVPRGEAFKRRLNSLTVKLDKRDFQPRSLEVDGKSGVTSVFAIDFTTLNAKLPADTFEVIKPK